MRMWSGARSRAGGEAHAPRSRYNWCVDYGGYGGFPIGDGPSVSIYELDTNEAELSPIDHGACGYTQHDPPADISFDYSAPTDPSQVLIAPSNATRSPHDRPSA